MRPLAEPRIDSGQERASCRLVDQQFKLTRTASNLMRLARMGIAVPPGAAPLGRR